jgi:hypothetical protein
MGTSVTKVMVLIIHVYRYEKKIQAAEHDFENIKWLPVERVSILYNCLVRSGFPVPFTFSMRCPLL